MEPVLSLPNDVIVMMISELLAQRCAGHTNSLNSLHTSNIIFVAQLAQLNKVIRSFLVLLAPFDWQLSLIPVRFASKSLWYSSTARSSLTA